MSQEMLDHHKIGRVVSLSGARVICVLDGEDIGADAETPSELQMGSLVKMPSNGSTVFGMINGMSIPIPSQSSGEAEFKIVEMDLIGEVPAQTNGAPATFRRGISAPPALGNEVYATSHDDVGLVYARPAKTTVEIGTIHQEKSLPAYAILDDLLGKHFAILGTTGSGKSCATALILHGIIEQHDNAHVVLLDPHGDYAQAFGEKAETIEPNDLQIPHWLFNFEEFVEIVFADESKELVTETTVLRNLIQTCKASFIGDGEDAHSVTVDTPVPYKMGDLTRIIDDTMGRLENRNDLAPYQRLKNRLSALQSDRRYAFMFPSSVVVRDNMAAILSRIFRIPVNGKPISIINLSGVPSEVLNVVVSVLCRMTFDFAMWSDQDTPILLVCEEAHRYAPQNSEQGFEPAKRALSRIAKEGRKYGISLGVISQRPSELATGLLSQCNTVFAMRMSSQKDQEFVHAAMSEASVGLLDSLPSLGNAEANAVGEAVTVPMRLSFRKLQPDQLPKSGTAEFSNAWKNGGDSEEGLQATIERWRRQRR